MGASIANLAAFRDLERRLKQIVQGKGIPGAPERLAAAVVKQVADEFRESRDPYGAPWKPLARQRSRQGRRRGRADKPLIDTGRMRASVTARVNGNRISVLIPVDYASYHQEGTARIPRRQMLPDGKTGGLGPRWTLALNKEAARILADHFGSKG